MKILQISSGDFFSTYGGGQVYVKNLVDTFLEIKKIRGNSNNDKDLIVIISFLNNIEKINKRNYNGADLWEVPENITGKDFEELIEKISPNIIHAHSHKALVCRIGNHKNIPVVVTSHHGGLWCPAGADMDCQDKICHRKINHKDCLPCVLRNTRTGLKYWYPFMKFLPEDKYLKLGNYLNKKPFIPFITPLGSAACHIKNKKDEWFEIVEKCSLMIAPSHKMAEVMIENGMPEAKVKVVPHGIPLPNEIPNFPEIKKGKIKFFYVGRICYVKGIHVLLKAFSNVKNTDIELHLIGGIGNKGEKRYMTRLQNKYREDKRIKWYGKISPEEVFDKIKDFHVAISPSIFLEAFGLNIAEALALGKPVLATQSGGGEMQIKDGFNGWLIASDDVSSLEKGIKKVINQTSRLPILTKNCQAKSINTHSNELFNIYYNLL